MNESRVKERARERLFEAEVREVFGMSAAVPRRTARASAWAAAAIALLAVGAVAAVAVSMRHDRASAQEPAPFDPMQPRWEAWWDLWTNNVDLTSSSQLADLDVARALSFRPRESALPLGGVLTAPGLRTLCVWGETTATEWNRGAEARDLTRLAITQAPRLGPEQLRELRLLPNLRELDLTQSPSRFTGACGQAVAELPRLQMLMLNEVDATADGIAALSGLAELDTLMLWSNPSKGGPFTELVGAITGLRNLRALGLWPRAETTFAAGDLHELARLPRLEVLDLGFGKLDDDALRALPDGLVSLGLADLRPATADGVRELARRRGLRAIELHADVPEHLEAAMAHVLRTLPIERVELWTAQPALLTALADCATLTRMTVRSPYDADYGRFAELTSLRELELHHRRYPDPSQLEALRNAPNLRILHLYGGRPPDDTMRDAIREAVGADIQVEFPRR